MKLSRDEDDADGEVKEDEGKLRLPPTMQKISMVVGNQQKLVEKSKPCKPPEESVAKPSWDRHGTSPILSRDLSLKDAVKLCAQAVKRENDRIPESEADMRIARRRMPKNRTDSLLRSGAPIEEVAKRAALSVVEQWVNLLRKHVPANEMAVTLTEIVHGCSLPLAAGLLRSQSVGDLSGTTHSEGRLTLNPNPTPPPWTPLGIALRKLLPTSGQCDFVEDIMAAVNLEDEYVVTSPSHIRRPNTAVRSELDFQRFHEAKLDSRVKPDFIKRKDSADGGHLSTGSIDSKLAHRAAVPTVVRLSGEWGGWATYSPSMSSRLTYFHETTSNMPGPGDYKRPVSSMRPSRISKYPSVGKLRTVGSAVMGSVGERFA